MKGGPINDKVSSSMRPGHAQRVFVNVTSPSVASISDRLKAMDFSNDLKNVSATDKLTDNAEGNSAFEDGV